MIPDIKPQLLVVPLKTLPLLQKMDKADQWYGLVPEIMNVTFVWMNEPIKSLTITDDVKPYFNYTLSIKSTQPWVLHETFKVIYFTKT